MKKEKTKRNFGDRKDARIVRGMDPLHNIMNNLMGNRTENEAITKFEIDITNLNKYLEEKNKDCTDSRFKYTFFHAILATFARTIQERNMLNYFIRKGKYYERNDISFSYIAKKVKADNSEESMIIQRYKTNSDDSPIKQMHDKTCKQVSEIREQKNDGSDTDKAIKAFLKLPSPILKLFFVILRKLDKNGRVPNVLHNLIPYYSTVFFANLGSIKLNSEYHHLINFGTNSIFAVIGTKFKKHAYDDEGNVVSFHEYIPISLTVDERIADGVYFANSIKMIQAILNKPELLDVSANQPISL